MGELGFEVIARTLRENGLDAKAIDGWVYVALADGRLLYIGAEYGQSLETTIYATPPEWFRKAEPVR